MKILGIKLNKDLRITYCKTQNGNKYNPPIGEEVIVETPRGLERAIVLMKLNQAKDDKCKNINSTLIRRCNNKDRNITNRNTSIAKQGLEFCKIQIKTLKLEIKLVDAFVNYDANKLIIYFTADGRIDFRKLVKEMANKFKVRIEMRQIGVRDGVGNFGGVGICGRPLCCSSFKDNFGVITVNMAKDQNLSLNPGKISGICGRLMCCLRYEHNTYKKQSKKMPKLHQKINTPYGEGTVMELDIPQMLVKVKLTESAEIKTLDVCKLI